MKKPTPTPKHIEVPIVVTGGTIPEYAHPGDAGADLTAANTSDVVIYPGQTKLIPSGMKVAVPEGYELQVRSRSGLASKNSIHVLNSPGCVDSGYRGEVGVILHNAHEHLCFTVKPGMKIAQAVFAPVVKAVFVKVDALDETVRGEGAYGSSGL